MTNKGKTALVLGGGVGRAHNHVGVLWAMEYYGIVPNLIVAVSSAGLAAAKYSERQKVKDVELVARKQFAKPPFNVSTLRLVRRPLKAPTLFNNKALRKIINGFDMEKIAESPIELEVLAVNVLTDTPRFFSNHRDDPETFKKALLATTAIPGLFDPVEIEGGLWVDGMLYSSFPLYRACERGCISIIGSYCYPKREAFSRQDYEELGWLQRIIGDSKFSSDYSVKSEVGRILRINERVRARKELLRRLWEKFQDRELVLAIKSTLKEEFGLDPLQEIELKISRPDNRVMPSSLRWDESDVVDLINGGRVAGLQALKNFNK